MRNQISSIIAVSALGVAGLVSSQTGEIDQLTQWAWLESIRPPHA
ncbi:hypothetical protein [Corynebacterium lubricantis]|nr:hypothetical protein [Corynebacterium lubricantis]